MCLEIVYLWHCNQERPIRFHRFMNQFLDSIQMKRDDKRFLGNHSVLETFLSYAHGKGYRSGFTGPMCLTYLDQILHSVEILLKSVRQGAVSETRYVALFKELKAIPTGLNDENTQMFIMTCASLQLYLPLDYLRYHVSPTKNLYTGLKKPFFGIQKPNQITQLHRCLLSRRPDLLPMQVDNLLLIVSDEKDCLKKPHLCYKNHNLHCPRIDERNRVHIERLCCRSNTKKTASTIHFNYSMRSNHYLPTWSQNPLGSSGWIASPPLVAHDIMKSPIFSSTLQEMINQIMDDTTIKSSWLPAYPEFLSSNLYVVLRDIEGEVCRHLGCSEAMLETWLSYSQKNGGSTCSIRIPVNPHLHAASDGNTLEINLSRLRGSRLPKFRLLSEKRPFYSNKEWAKISLLLHMLLIPETAQPPGRPLPSFISTALSQGKPGFLLLLQPSRNLPYSIASALIFTDTENRKNILASYLDPHGFPSDPFVIAELEE